MMGWYGYGMGGWGALVMVIVAIAVLGLLVAAIVALVRSGGRRSDPAERPAIDLPRPEELLAERYARGEIDEQDYRARLAVLRERVATARR